MRALILVCVALFIAITCTWHVFLPRNDSDFVASLQVDSKIKIVKVELTGNVSAKPVTVTLTNDSTLSYLSEICRIASPGSKSGQICYGKIVLTGNRIYTTDLIVNMDAKTLSFGVNEHFLHDATYYLTNLKDPIPEELKEALMIMSGRLK
jgi:hypothetical protein